MKSIIITYNTIDEYSAAYKEFTKQAFVVAVVKGLDLALTIKGDEVKTFLEMLPQMNRNITNLK